MTTNSYVEYFFTLLAWIMHNALTSILLGTGLALVPIIAVVVSSWLKARDQGHDEGNKGLLSLTWVETRLLVMAVIIVFTFMPYVPIDLGVIQYDETRSKQCGRVVVKPAETAWGASFSTLDGRTARVPIWWLVVHSVSKGVTASAISALPCGADLRQVQMKVDSTRLRDPYLRDEVGDFVFQCYAAARVKLLETRPKLSEEQITEAGWIGSSLFLDTPGYYDTFNAQSPRREWPFDPVRDAGYSITTQGGYPKCNEWWADSQLGLRTRLTAQVPKTTWELLKGAYDFRSSREVEDAMLKVLVSPRNQALTSGSVYTGYNSLDPNVGDIAAGAGAVVGSAVGGLGFFPLIASLRQSLPNIIAYITMAMIICIPVVLVVSTFDLKAAMSLTFTLFGLYFLDFWFELARWIDTRLIDALYGAGSPHSSLNLSGLSNATGDMFISFVTGAMFLILPPLWVGAMGLAGFKLGGVADAVTGAGSRTSTPAAEAKQTAGKLPNA